MLLNFDRWYMKRVHNRRFFQAIGLDLVCTLMVPTVGPGAHTPFFKYNAQIVLVTKTVVKRKRGKEINLNIIPR